MLPEPADDTAGDLGMRRTAHVHADVPGGHGVLTVVTATDMLAERCGRRGSAQQAATLPGMT